MNIYIYIHVYYITVKNLASFHRKHQRLALPVLHQVKRVLPKKACATPEHTLVLDLDETLVHCSTEQLVGYDFTFPVTVGGVEYVVYVRRRPYFEHFLQTVSKQVLSLSLCSFSPHFGFVWLVGIELLA